MPETKVCTGCSRELPVSAFRIRTRKNPKPRSRCRECEAEAQRAYYEKIPKKERKDRTREWERRNPKKHRRQIDRRRVRKAGIAEELVESIVDLIEATDRCQICGRHEDEVGTLRVDHCHGSGVFRGLICDSCNLGLGKFGDDPERLRAAADYLTQRASPRT